MKKIHVTSDELRAMVDSPKTLRPLEELDISDCWYPTIEYYRLEYMTREITRLRREKILLRAALQDALLLFDIVSKRNTKWHRRILTRALQKDQ